MFLKLIYFIKIDALILYALNYYGRFNFLREILQLKYFWSENLYDITFGVFVRLTNFRITLNLFHQVEGQRYYVLRKRLISNGENLSHKWNIALRNQPLKRRRNVVVKFREMGDSGDQDVPQTENTSNQQLQAHFSHTWNKVKCLVISKVLLNLSENMLYTLDNYQ